MANKKISDLPAAAAAALTDLYETEQGGTSKKETLQNLKDVIRPFKIYRALLTQAGVAAPVATILENTIGAAVWSYNSPGDYRLTLAGAFPIAKTIITTQICTNVNLFGVIPVVTGGPNEIALNAYDDIGAGTQNDNVLTNTPFTVIVYP